MSTTDFVTELHRTVAIVGAGHAGVQAAESLRREGFTGRIALFDAEDCSPYQRPPLSKDYMLSDANQPAPKPLPLRGDRFYAEHDIELIRGVTVVGIDRSASAVIYESADGIRESLQYDSLIFATGAHGREVDLPGRSAAGIHELRTLGDAERLRADLLERNNSASDSASVDGMRVVVIGAGFIGLEFAAAAHEHGVRSVVLDRNARPMSRSLTPALSTWMAQSHRDMGTEFIFGAEVAEFEVAADGYVCGVVLQDGSVIPADLVLLGVGVRPRTELAAAAGLDVEGGIVVDSSLRTTDPNIYAIGDCASFPEPSVGKRLRLESVQNATDHAKHVARVIAVGCTEPYSELPVFWSHQGPIKLQIAGITDPSDDAEVIGDTERGKFSVRSTRSGQVRAVESVRDPRTHMTAKKELSARLALEPVG